MRKSSKILWRIAWFIFASAVLYVTLSPFHFRFGWDYFHSRLQHMDLFPILIPPHYWIDWQDNINNVILFMPLGFFGFWSVGRPSRLKCIILVAAGFLFSMSIEFTQLFIEPRDTSLSDLTTNTLGTALGVWLADKANRG